jgi:glutamine amidotransferase-like uncharacterized protein
MSVYIYNDLGVSKESLKHTVYSVSNFMPRHKIILLNSVDIVNYDWPSKASLLVLPGGKDVLYAKKLNGLGNEIIKDYVIKGGTYLGICAGSYYASKFVEFDKGGDLEILQSRELSFFEDKAIGPILAPYNYENNSGVRAARIILNLPFFREDPFYVYYNGGGYFKNAENYDNTEVIARYEANGLPAIIKVKFGKGVAILSAIHFEYSTGLFNKADEHQMRLLPFLENNFANMQFCQYLFGSFIGSY